MTKELTAKSEALAAAVVKDQSPPATQPPAEDEAPPEPAVQRRKVGRGSTRRIIRAKAALDAALVLFRKEMDREVYQVDANGERTGAWPVLTEVDAFRASIVAQVNEILA